MKQRSKTAVLLILSVLLCASLFLTPAALALEEGESYEVAADTPFSSQTNNGASYRLSKTERLEDGSYRITQDTAVDSTTRLFYGEGTTAYGVDLTDFRMEFSFDRYLSQTGVYGGFSISFQRGPNEFPMDSYMVGFSLYFADIGNAFEMTLFRHDAQGQHEISKYYLVYNNNGRPDCLGKTIVLTIGSEEGNDANLLLDLRYLVDEGTTEADMVPFRAQIAKSSLTEIGLDIGNAVLFFAPRSGLSGDLIWTIGSIEEPNTNAYLNAPDRVALLEKIGALETAMAGFDSYGAYEDFLNEQAIDPSILRAYDRAQQMAFFDPAYRALIASLVPADAQTTESRSNYTTAVRNNQDGSYAEMLKDGREKLILVNDFKTDGSGLGLKKTVDIRDFLYRFTVDRNFANARFTLLFGPTPDCYNHGTMSIPGIAITLMGNADGFNILIENAAGAQAVEGVSCDQFHVLVDGSGAWVTLPYSAEGEIVLTMKEDEGQNIVMTLTSGGQSASAAFSKAFLDAGQLDVAQMYFKVSAGHQALPFGSGYLELTVREIADASATAAAEEIRSFLAQAEEASTAEAAAELLTKAPEAGMLFMQQDALLADLEEALGGLKEIVETELTILVQAFADAAAAVADTAAGTLTAEKVAVAQAGQDAFYAKAELLDLLSVAQINQIRSILDPAEYLLERAELYLLINDYVAKAGAIAGKEDLAAAQEAGQAITEGALSFLSAEDLEEAQTLLAAAGEQVRAGEQTFAKKSCVGAMTGEALWLAVSLLTLGIVGLKKKAAEEFR